MVITNNEQILLKVNKVIRKYGNKFFNKSVTVNIHQNCFYDTNLLPYSPIHLFTFRKRFAFTLAEVLITLGIIGVVAALTIPTLVAKYQEQVTVNKVKKIYSILSQAVMLSINDNGYPNEWNVSDNWTKESTEEFARYITPYLKFVKDCGTENECYGYTDKIKYLNSTDNRDIEGNNRYYKLILTDGTYIFLRSSAGNYCHEEQLDGLVACGEIDFDINGSKAPNTLGKDIFVIPISKNGTKTQSIQNDSNCFLDSEGWSCLTHIISNGNMNYPKTKPEGE